MKLKAAIIFFFCFVVAGCNNDFTDYGYVNFYIEPDSTEYYNLNLGTRQWEYFEGGYRGIIIVRNSYEEFKVYERSCTAKDCHGRLEVNENNNVIIFCPNCNSQFLCYDGSPLSGSKAKRFLYAYCSFFDGTYLWVNNCKGDF
jgi:nitrite reductase/ring-hydroxylating ferredoxin subunit